MTKWIGVSLLLFIAILLHLDRLQAQKTTLNPGVKLGYTLGENGGFTWGFEISLASGRGPWFGGVLDIDFCRHRTKIHAGAQISYVGGLSVGPTWILENGQAGPGFTLTLFAGAVLYPYYAYTYQRKNPSLHEIGGYLKVPLLLRKGDIYLVKFWKGEF